MFDGGDGGAMGNRPGAKWTCDSQHEEKPNCRLHFLLHCPSIGGARRTCRVASDLDSLGVSTIAMRRAEVCSQE